MNGDAIKAGEAFVEGTFKDSKLVEGLKRGQSKLHAFAATVQKTIVPIGAAVTAAMAPIFLSLNKFTEVGAKLDDMSKRTGVAVEKLDALRFAADQSGTSIDTVESGIVAMQRSLLKAEQGVASTTKALAELGLSAEDFRGKSPDEQFALLAERIRGVEDPSRKAALAMKLLGGSGQELLPMIEDMDELTAKARELGLVMSADDATAAAELDDALALMNASLERSMTIFGAVVAPIATEFVDGLTKAILKINEFIDKNEDLIETVKLLAKIANPALFMDIDFDAIGKPGMPKTNVLAPAADASAPAAPRPRAKTTPSIGVLESILPKSDLKWMKDFMEGDEKAKAAQTPLARARSAAGTIAGYALNAPQLATNAVVGAATASLETTDVERDSIERERRRNDELERLDDQRRQLEIDLMPEGREKSMARIDEEERTAMRDMKDAGLLDEDMIEQIRGLSSLQREVYDKGNPEAAHAVASSGTLRGDLAAQQLGGMTIDDKQWETQKQMLKRLEEIRDKDGGLTVGA